MLSETIKLHPRRSRTRVPNAMSLAPSSPIEQSIWPAEVDVILSAMDAAKSDGGNRRGRARLPYRVRAKLTLFADQSGAPPHTLYTRDADQRGLGFITQHRLPLGYGGWVELPAPSGRKMRIPCTLFRCRQTVPGWYEGALYFNREQWAFVPEL